MSPLGEDDPLVDEEKAEETKQFMSMIDLRAVAAKAMDDAATEFMVTLTDRIEVDGGYRIAVGPEVVALAEAWLASVRAYRATGGLRPDNGGLSREGFAALQALKLVA
jgi:hypothetical protein